MKSYRYRDLTITSLNEEQELVTSTDISSGFGEMANDLIHCSLETTASFTLRTTLLELIAYGATPISIIDDLSLKFLPNGERVIKRLQSDLNEIGYDQIPINGSTEDNLKIDLTSVSVTANGLAKPKEQIKGAEFAVFQLGTPLVGEAVLNSLDKVFTVKRALEIRNDALICDMIPVGSQGIGHEISVLAKEYKLNSIVKTKSDLNLSAGPSTVLLVVSANVDRTEVEDNFPDLKYIARMKR
ncbi:hypothetical protein [Pediococcus claussenii]|uniref:Uncharacterized protein n=1 Tax=Pediococcus claussenii (strain ATCC BAA-344 / DSM 14800 / JCM 18046 / KCTC 3811 / LMG 21948 / P06) TaxID=701521 RepID=G8PEM7_PEDCP|nr:hypothetical protein [Pediococcus claussenii]AEV95636.1 hypothetical protein PECL_1412 [Pediococcus claussenii ATCC BAA-344]ANZ69156.1 hypothetical protein AYR57_02035 [Pediococcus claussenii]ANZ70973.1 hypothetical protein AYR58_02035 [Pediococcus claussenii]KRN20131.1 hypothetical protein IV79_GL000796 [Pediococcus claussenii]